jgi:hypothetical protein
VLRNRRDAPGEVRERERSDEARMRELEAGRNIVEGEKGDRGSMAMDGRLLH